MQNEGAQSVKATPTSSTNVNVRDVSSASKVNNDNVDENYVNNNDVVRVSDLVRAINAIKASDVNKANVAAKVSDVNKANILNYVNNNDINAGDVGKTVLSICNSTEFSNNEYANAIDKVDISFSPSIVVPLIDKEGDKYRVRTLIDSGSGANWITQHILAHVKHTVLGYCHLRIETFNGVRPGRFQIVEVYYEDESKEEQQSITCFVHDKFTKHVTVQGLVNFITRKCKTRKAFQNLVDPATKNVDHAEMDLGTGLILSTAI